MNPLTKFFSRLKRFGKKDAAPQGGLELLAKLTSEEMGRKNFLQQYGKSLYVFACISKIASKTAAVPLKLFKVLDSKGNTKEIQTHPALDLLYRVNPFQTKTEFLETSIINLKCTGDAFWYKVKNKSGRVVELWNLRPDWMTIMTDPVQFIKTYRFNRADGVQVDFEPEEIVHFKYPDPLSNYLGMSPLKPAQKRVQIEENANRWQADFFLNNSRPDALIKNKDVTLTKEQKEDIREGWNKLYKGPGNSAKVAILEGGLEYQLISLTQKEMDFIESMRFTRDDILVAFAVPKPIVAITDDVNRANAETAMFIFLSETIKPEIARLVEKINEEMIYPDFGDEFFIDFVDPTPANRELQLKENSEGLVNSYLLINEVRAREGFPPIKGGWSFYRPLTDVPMGGLPQSEAKMVRIGGKTKEDAYEFMPAERKYDFRGRFYLKQKLELKEAIMKRLTYAIEKAARKKISKEKKKKANKSYVSFLKTPELKKTYAEILLKKIDARTGKIKDATNEFAAGQQARVLAALNEKTKGKKAITVKVEEIFDKAKEDGIAIEFITPYLTQFLTDSGLEALRLLAPQEDFKDTKKIQKVIQRRAAEFAESVNSTTLQKLDSTLAEGISDGEGIRDLSQRVEETYKDFPLYRSEMIARTEATAANNEGSLEGFKQSDVATGKEWINAGDDRVRPEHQDGIGVGGEIVGLNEIFSNGLQYPQEPNCRCVLGPAFLE